jgi:hypothetical protein
MRNAPRPCPVKYCTHTLPWPRASFCQRCFARIPGDIRGRMDDATRKQAAHLVGAAVIEARVWLDAHPPGADPRTGEAPT